MSGLDARLRRLFAPADTSPGFEARVLARVAALGTAPAADRRARVEQRRDLERRRLRREAWLNGVIAAGIGAAGVAVVLRHGEDVGQWALELAAVAADPSLSMGFALAVLAAGAWPLLRGLLPR